MHAFRSAALLLRTLLAVALLLCGSALASNASLPVVLWHGLGATTHTGGTSEIKEFLEAQLGAYVFSISTGGSDAEQTYSDFFGSIDAQVADVCASIAAKPELAGGFNALGLSQGGLFLRAVAEHCQHTGPRMRTLVTLGSPHQGVVNIPTCTGAGGDACWPCRAMRRLLAWGAYLPWVRSHVIQAQFFKDPWDRAAYLASNPFLPVLNNERPQARDPQRAANLASLRQLALFRFEGDFTVVPRDSAWFSDPQGAALVPLRQTALYQEDWLGLRRLDAAGRLELAGLPGRHMQFSLEQLRERVVVPYLMGGAQQPLPAA